MSKLIKCADCEREVSPRANTCPHCGAPVEAGEAPPLPPTPPQNVDDKQKARMRRRWLAVLGVALVVACLIFPTLAVGLGAVLLLGCVPAFIPQTKSLTRRLLRAEDGTWRGDMRLAGYMVVGFVLLFGGVAWMQVQSGIVHREQLISDANAKVVRMAADARKAWQHHDMTIAQKEINTAWATPHATDLSPLKRLRTDMANAKVQRMVKQAKESLRGGHVGGAKQTLQYAMTVSHADNFAEAKKLEHVIDQSADTAHVKEVLMGLSDRAFGKFKAKGILPSPLKSGYDGLDRNTLKAAKAQLVSVTDARQRRAEKIKQQKTAQAEAARKAVPSSPPGGYKISAEPAVLPSGSVHVAIKTNIPGEIEVMANLSLHGQKDEEVWIGKDEKVRISKGSGEVTFATDDLPKGQYDVEVDFYPRWGFKDAPSRATGITKNLITISSVSLTGNGTSSADTQFKKNNQKWVMEHVATGDPWHPSDWTNKFGDYRELSVDRFNPKIIKAYYFPRIDMTVIVNTLKGEISTWRLGEAHH